MGKRRARSRAAAFALSLLVGGALPALGRAVAIVDGTEIYVASHGDAIGDFHAVAGNRDDSSPGHVLEVLGGSQAPRLRDDGAESGHNAIAMGSLWSVLATELTSTHDLVFGFGLNETGPIGTNWVDITELVLSFERPGGGIDVFSLAPDSVRVTNYLQGTTSAEALFQLHLGFDFMAEYGADSTELFTISAAVENTSDGFEIVFLSAAFTGRPLNAPEPGTLALLGAGLAGLAAARRRR